MCHSHPDSVTKQRLVMLKYSKLTDWVLVWWRWHFDWNFACLAPVVTTTSITLSSNKIQNGDILVLGNLENGHRSGDRIVKALLKMYS